MRLPQRTVAGRIASGQVIYWTGRGKDAAARMYDKITVGYQAIDGAIFESRGVLDERLHESIATARSIQESYNNGKKAIIRRKGRR